MVAIAGVTVVVAAVRDLLAGLDAADVSRFLPVLRHLGCQYELHLPES